jgi:hypothetical protein
MKKQPLTQFTRSIGGGADKAMNAPPITIIHLRPQLGGMPPSPMPAPKVAPLKKAVIKPAKMKIPKGPNGRGMK